MILGGKKPAHNVKTLVLPRDSGDNLVFKAGAVATMDEFEKLCPVPIAPLKVLKGGQKVADLDDKGYQLALQQQVDKRWDYIILKSLQATPDLQWETVDMQNPDTWQNWKREAADSGLSVFEINKIIACVVEANSLNEQTLEEARNTFLANQVQV